MQLRRLPTREWITRVFEKKKKIEFHRHLRFKTIIRQQRSRKKNKGLIRRLLLCNHVKYFHKFK